MMHMEHRLSQTLSQRLMLTQKMQQAIQILQLSGMELEQYVQQELEANPFLAGELRSRQLDPLAFRRCNLRSISISLVIKKSSGSAIHNIKSHVRILGQL